MNKINDKGGWKLGKWVVKFPDDKLEKKKNNNNPTTKSNMANRMNDRIKSSNKNPRPN